MVNINPVGIFGFDDKEGQFTPITGNNIPVDTALTPLRLAGVQGFTGFIGLTGLDGIAGDTGASLFGVTGLIGDLGITGLIGVTGLTGATGIIGATGVAFNETGLDGFTGMQGHTGLAGLTGIRGFTGTFGITGETGLTGDTGISGLTGNAFAGITGLLGDTGLQGITGIQGTTGFAFVGATGIQGVTGLAGLTGLYGTITLDASVQSVGTELTYDIPANTITATGQQIEFYASGLTAGQQVSTNIFVTFGGVIIFSDIRNDENSSTFTIEGLIIKQDGNNQEIGIKALYTNSRGTAARTATTLNMASLQSLSVNAESGGFGNAVLTLIVRRISAPII